MNNYFLSVLHGVTMLLGHCKQYLGVAMGSSMGCVLDILCVRPVW